MDGGLIYIRNFEMQKDAQGVNFIGGFLSLQDSLLIVHHPHRHGHRVIPYGRQSLVVAGLQSVVRSPYPPPAMSDSKPAEKRGVRGAEQSTAVG